MRSSSIQPWHRSMYSTILRFRSWISFAMTGHAAANAILTDILPITPLENLMRSARLLCSCRCAPPSVPMYCWPASPALVTTRRCHAVGPGLISRLARLTIRPPAPSLWLSAGLSGTGKSFWRARSRRCHAVAGSCRVTHRACCESVNFSSMKRTGCRGARTSRRLRPDLRSLERRAARILVQGHSVVVDAVFALEPERAAICDAARS